MKLTLRNIERQDPGRISDQDYQLIEGWWSRRGITPPAQPLLPGMGVIVMAGNAPVACCFMYLDATGSGVCQLAWPATALAIGPVRAKKALVYAMQFLIMEARRMDYWCVTTMVHSAGFVPLFEDLGFTQEKPAIPMILPLL